MKKIGIVGGTAWNSTVEYYSMLNKLAQEAGCNPEFSIESLDLARASSYIGKLESDESWQRFDSYHRDGLLRVASSGAEVALLAANTPHHRYEAITRDVGIPVVNIYDVVASACAKRQIDRVLVLGTRLTMMSLVLRDRFACAGVSAVVPPRDGHAPIIALIEGLQTGEARDPVQAIAAASEPFIASGINAILLGCTELALAFPEYKHTPFFEKDDIVYVNTLAIHAHATFDLARDAKTTSLTG